ncbi:MAG: hypothetical protein HYT72_04260 [Candidatus Aenigmarchaeota archaeon]|nr:hypothetical protein [Candidatus Aenigmarchaeota archaeon]
MVTITGDPVLGKFRQTVIDVVTKYQGVNRLHLGYPSSPSRDLPYNPDDVPIPLSLTGFEISDDAVRDIGTALGVAFVKDTGYRKGLRKGLKTLENPASGAVYSFSVELWDASALSSGYPAD